MAYIGRGTDSISNVEVLDNITFSGASSYTLQKGSANYVPISAANILVSIDGVVQANNFSVNGSTIDFGVAIANTSTCNFVLHFGTGLITTVQDGAVTTVKIGNDAVTYAKLQNLATANRVLGSTSTGLIGETQIATAMVSDDAITYAKMQDTSAANRVLGAASAGTVGEVQVATDMIADAQVDESKLKISNAPTNGYFLSAQSGGSGGMTWAEAGGGAMVKLGETNVTSGTASVTFDGLFSSTYPNYKLIITDLVSASAEQARLRVMIGGSESSVNEYYSGHASVQASSGGGSLDGSRIWPATSFQLLNQNISTNTREVSMFYIDIPNPLYASSNPTFSQRHMVNQGNSSMIVAGTGGYFYYAQTAISGVKFFMNSGNINYGNFYLYGIKG